MTYSRTRAGAAVLAAALLTPAVLPAESAPHPIAARVEAAQKSDQPFVTADLWSGVDSLGALHTKAAWGAYAELSGALADATFMELRPAALRALRTQAPERLTVEVPFLKAPSGALVLDLVRVRFFAADFSVETAQPDARPAGDIGAHYLGVLRGEPGSLAAVSIYGDEVVGFIGSESHGHVAVGTVEQGPLQIARGGRTRYVAYAEDDLAGFEASFSCQFRPDHPLDPPPASTVPTPPAVTVPTADVFAPNPVEAKAPGDCVNLYFEADFTLYRARGAG
ncbi:MAG: hypothetical protein AAGF23_09595, partial [Acidobacteriota bacterium]